MTCCKEYGCRRSKPFLVRRSDLTGRWMLVSDYTRDGQAVIAKTGGKHEVTVEIQEAVIAAVFEKLADKFPPSDLDPIAESFGLIRKVPA